MCLFYYFIMLLCCHVIPGLGHVTRVPVEQSVPVMAVRTVFISLHEHGGA